MKKARARGDEQSKGRKEEAQLTKNTDTTIEVPVDETGRTVFDVVKYGQNALPGKAEGLVAKVTLDELKEADRDYPNARVSTEATEKKLEPSPLSSSTTIASNTSFDDLLRR